MRLVTCSLVLGLLTGLVLAPRVAFAQLGPTDSDLLYETITDQNGLTVDTPLSWKIAEDPNEVGASTFLVPKLTVDFLELGGTTQELSDRFHFDPFNVVVTSDGDNPSGLPPRSGTGSNTTRVPASALESFTPVEFFAHSDGDNPDPTQQESDRIQGFVYGSPAPVFDFTFFEAPDPSSDSPPSIPFSIPAMSYDVLELDAAGNQIVSDYVDVGPITGYFVSSDDPAEYQLYDYVSTDGYVTEDATYGGDLKFKLNFVSDGEVPEPGSLLLLGIALLSGSLLGQRRRIM